VLDSVYGPPESGSPHAAPPPTSRRDIVWDRAGTNFLAYHLHAAVQERASEIHFIPAGADLTVAYRTDAGLVTQTPEQPETSLYLRARLGVLGIPDVDGERTSAWGAAIVELGPDRIAVSACHSRTDAGVATVLRLAPAPVEAPDLSLLGLSPIGEAEIREFIDGPEGLIVVTGPPRAGGSLVLASLAALAARADRRTLVFEPAHLLPYPPGTIRIPATDAARWEQLAVGLGADVVALDGVVNGEQVETLLHGAAVGRLVFVRTDWLDPKALLAHLTRSRAGRSALRDRPFALIALPAARREGSAVWVDPSRAEIQAGSLQVTILSDEKRDALAKEGGR
jgi:protein transport protein HofB